MPAAGRLGDKAQCPSDSHGCPSCAHGVVGPAVAGSSNTFVNGKSALRVGDPGVHSSCCGPNTWNVAKGAPGVYINSIKAHRKGDATTHCGGMGKLIDGSPDVFIGDTGGSSIPPSIPEPDYDQGFVVVHEPSGFPLRDLPYKITKHLL